MTVTTYRFFSHARLSTWRWPIVVGFVLASLFPVDSLRNEDPHPAFGAEGQVRGKQGEVLFVTVPIQEQPDRVTGKFLQRTLTFFPHQDNTYAGLLGVDMQDQPGEYPLTIHIVYPQRTERRHVSVLVLKQAYPEQRLTLPKAMVDLDQKTLVRVKAESQALRQAFESVVPRPLWKGRFLEPVRGQISGRFGSRRIINGQPRSPHSGEDVAAPEGTPVAAMNHGIVRLTINHFFTGKGVIVDHGLGLFSMYFHLSAVDVEQDQTVQKGQMIGKVGSTGRATGPHLHWGVRLNGARVDPYSLLALP